MDTVSEDVTRSDVDAEMTMLVSDDVTEQNADVSDEVENLRNSLREAVHDDSVRPKMQCLMMDSSFSMVTVQGEDSGIAWETTPSRCTTPWASEAGAADVGSPTGLRPATPGSHPAGKIIFVMDEEMISRRRKERVSSQKSKAEKQEVLEGSSENVSGRPELVEVSQPNVKTEGEGDQEEATDPLEDKEQRLFSIVAEGSEILNIVVPPKLATVDEEESKEMVDNLSYLEESLVAKASEETQDNELLIPGAEAETSDQVKPSPRAMDPPGAPVARPPVRGAAGNVDYFEAFSLIDAQAPGSPAVIMQRQEEPEAETEAETTITNQDADKPEAEDNTITTTVDNDKSDAVSLEEITSELLDEVFYGGTENYPEKSLDTADGATGGTTHRLPSKPSGSSLFGSQEEILTPIFLPEGPQKIIDLILLEEPKAMAFLYTDLYEEAIGSRQKDEDAGSMTSEKSFHSRHSDREARGYLEKYVLIDETPAVEMEQTDTENYLEEDLRRLPQDLYDFEDIQANSQKEETQNSEGVTDFFRSSANSSPCDVEPFSRSAEEDDTQTTTKSKAKTQKSVSITAEKVEETPIEPLSISAFEFPPDWGDSDEYPTPQDEKHVHVHSDEESRKHDSDTNKPVAPPRRKPASSPKSCLDLTPLTPVDVITQEKEEAEGKEQREEEKETASPVETADEGDGDGEETVPASEEMLTNNAVAVLETGPLESESPKDCSETAEPLLHGDANPAEEKDVKTDEIEGRSETETVAKQTELTETDVKSGVETEINPEKQEDISVALSAGPAKNKGNCIIL
ncbi:cardiomyopathy-associated protein 5 [Melanotaenia boesemani]|uniref:cardiomyopathy-associated protein 5 n=1 Tax=Melanotaenia boesemani TaxID=1250792 RepID=UPI001C058FE2|nr:cardiomyopathy-associated protein 5 [Melanotaenia boesemani]